MLSTTARYAATCAACKQPISPGNAIALGQFHNACIHESCHAKAWTVWLKTPEAQDIRAGKREHDLEQASLLAEARDLESTPTLTPPPGSYAATARAMAGLNPSNEDGEFWDGWKDEMKERC